MTKGRVIYLLVFLVAMAVFGSVYQFYLKGQLQIYAKNKQLKDQLEQKFTELETFFSGVQPEVITSAWRSQVQPWTDAKINRAKYFTYGDWFDHERPPREGPILKFWYDEQSRKMVGALYQHVAEKLNGNYSLFPPDIRTNLNVATVDQWASENVTEQMVNQQLARLNFGIKLSQMLLDAKATSVRNVTLWPQRTEKTTANLLNLQTAGLEFTMSMRDFVMFIDQLRQADRYYSVNALKVAYPYIAYPAEPQLSIDMLLTQAGFKNSALPNSAAGPAGPGTAPTLGATESNAEDVYKGLPQNTRRLNAPPPPAEPGVFGKAWKLFKRYVLYMN